MLLLRPIILLVSLCCVWSVSADGSRKESADLLEISAIRSEGSVHSLLLDVSLAGDRLIAVGEKGHILYSDNQGEDWMQAQVPVQVTLTATHFPTPTLGWAVGHDGVILHSKDGGETWHKQLDGYQTGTLMALAARHRIEELTQSIELAQLKGKSKNALKDARENAEIALEEAQTEIAEGPNRPLLDVWFSSEEIGYASGAFGYLFRTTDGGERWEDISLSVSNPERLHLYTIQGWSDGTLLALGEFGLTLRSEDAGETWNTVDLGYEGTLFSVRRGFTEDDAFIVGLRSNVFYSADRGLNWTRQTLPPGPTLLGVATSNEKAVMVGVAGAIVELAANKIDTRNFSRKSRVNLSSVAVLDSQVLILVGEMGIQRLSADGEVLPIRYVANREASNTEYFPPTQGLSIDSVNTQKKQEAQVTSL